MARDPRLAEAMYRAAKEHGVSAMSSRFFLGWTDLHKQLERDLIGFFGTEEACILPAGYLGGIVYFCSMADAYRTAFCDELSHANLIRGMGAGGFEIHKYRHLDADDLERQLAAYDGPPPIIATDGVFGISGDLAPVGKLAELNRQAGGELLVDDAHGVFAVGETGKGACEAVGVDLNSVTVQGSMSKALGASGGFFVGRKTIVEKLQRGSIGSTPLPMPIVAACIEAVRIVREEPERRARMRQHADRMRAILAAHGVGVVSDKGSVVAMILKDGEDAARLGKHFESRGLMIRYARYPSEPRENVLRAAARACYTEDDFQRFEQAVAEYFT
jgi:7-keto-8-aminopelargonate synthetase-like enzyme